jgi:hypothetical protein
MWWEFVLRQVQSIHELLVVLLMSYCWQVAAKGETNKTDQTYEDGIGTVGCLHSKKIIHKKISSLSKS